MEVKLLNYTPKPDDICFETAKICYQSKTTDKEQLLNKIIKAGHLSILEHASFTFLIEGISRVASHQLVRHRIASYTQQSHRYTKADGFYIPDSIKLSDKATEAFDEVIYTAYTVYEELIDAGIPKEDARYILPTAIISDIVVTMNARELLHFFTLRTCVRAQKEIRNIAIEMLKLVKQVAPIIFKDAGPSCVRGRCTEEKPCQNIIEIRNLFRRY